MKPLNRFFAFLLCMVTVLMGCQRTTTVILPPDTSPSIKPTQANATTFPTDPIPTRPTKPDADPATDPVLTESTAAPTVYDPPVSSPTAAHTTTPVTDPEPTQNPVYDISRHQIGSLEYALLDAINQHRAAEELPKLTLDSTLCALAAIRSYECAENFSHMRPDGRSCYSVLSDYEYAGWGNLDERIHYNSPGFTSDSIVRWWMNNDGFSGSILSDAYTAIGIGIYTHGTTTYITCFFAG